MSWKGIKGVALETLFCRRRVGKRVREKGVAWKSSRIILTVMDPMALASTHTRCVCVKEGEGGREGGRGGN